MRKLLTADVKCGGSEVNSLITASGRICPTAALTAAASSASANDRLRAHFRQPCGAGRSRERENLMLVRSGDGPAACRWRRSHRRSEFSFVDRGQPPGIGGVGDENREQARRFSGARVLTDLVMRARRLNPVLTSVEHLYLAAIHLAPDRAREHVADDNGQRAWACAGVLPPGG
jgi:hypothetical protein